MIPEDMPSLSDNEYRISTQVPDAFEQMVVELINRARMDPLGEAARQGTSLGSGVSPNPSQPVAVDPMLDAAASLHSYNMIARDFFDHDDPDTGTNPGARINAEGYFGGWGENIGIIWSGSNPEVQSRLEDHHDNLWNSLSHRQNFMNDTWTEVGVGFDHGPHTYYNGQVYNGSSVVTENFGNRGYTFLTGVIIDDLDNDEFYDVGEGQGGVRITAYNDDVAVGTTSWDAGGYSLRLGNGTYTVVFDGGDLDGHYVTTVTIAGENVKLDVIEDRDAIQDGEDPLPPAPDPEPEFIFVEGSGDSDRLRGSAADEVFVSQGGLKDKMISRGGNDIFVFGDETSNDVREKDIITDFDAEMDMIVLADGVDVVNSTHNRKGFLVLKLSGDRDKIVIKEELSFEDITIQNGTSDFLA